MSAVAEYLERIALHDLSDFVPLRIAGEVMGAVNPVWHARLLSCPSGLFMAEGEALACRLTGNSHENSRLLDAAARGWCEAGWLSGWRDEKFASYQANGLPLFQLDRAAFRPLGLTSHAAHINGLTRLSSGEVRMWVGRRSPDKSFEPNRMDNLVGGGVAAGETVHDACLREGWEEAGISAERLAPLTVASRILAERPVARGLHREWLHAFDLWLPEGVKPANQDGEVAEYSLLPLTEVEALLLQERFMADAALVAIDCLLRLGYWGEQEAGIAAVFDSLRQWPATATPPLPAGMPI
ncbi:NUDIX hydrolase [Craterilacuibacter sinensis]|uniref:DUF4743 domain-containing protein n=1 Tax=Craterilacuibacter sinensis TaxID=2686017 RepID=A0A845BT31_9NEIS|nr:DUF4743 domain-containing protein [Craterilacuibacter sinensis]MXR37731.1 DUF4743 domain-containing protein [Craterilacuibacter sinensis]